VSVLLPSEFPALSLWGCDADSVLLASPREPSLELVISLNCYMLFDLGKYTTAISTASELLIIFRALY